MKRLPLLFCLMLLPLLSTQAHAVPGYLREQMGNLSGQLFVEDKPLAKGIIALFPVQRGLPPISTDMRSIPEYLGRTNAEGEFSVDLLPGSYYLGMIQRENNNTPGPPQPGEPFFFASEPSGALRQFTVAFQEKVAAGRINGAKPETFKEVSSTFTITGAVVDDQGQPFPEVLVFAKAEMSQSRPDFISERTGKDGLFTLRVPAGRTFYLFARPSIGFRKPAPGEAMGVYGVKSASGLISPVVSGVGGPPPGVVGGSEDPAGNNPKPVKGSDGEVISGLQIVMYKIPDAEELKTSLQGKDTSPMFELGASLNNIYFAVNSDRLEERSFPELDKWASFLKGSPNITLEISGHTDSTGSKAYNLKLSEKRAAAVAKYLQEHGIYAQRMEVIGYGPEHPVDDNSTAAGREKNRRVEIRFIQ